MKFSLNLNYGEEKAIHEMGLLEVFGFCHCKSESADDGDVLLPFVANNW